MKRKEPTAADAQDQKQPRGRQPQTSCLNCRAKKIKCDRGVPCASCTVRGIPCMGQPGPKPAVIPRYNAVGPGTDISILSRLANLERAVFGDAQNGDTTDENRPAKGPLQPSSASSPVTAANTPSTVSHKDTERQRAARFLDVTYTREDHSTHTPMRRWHFRIAPISSHPNQPISKYGAWREDPSRSALIMTRDEALLLLQDFLHNPYHLLPIIYEPTVRSLINTFYTRLEQGYEGDTAAAALILSIASTSASFFSPDAAVHNIFASVEEAMEASVAWRQTALAVLDDLSSPTDVSLERCQARAILAYVVCNIEGCSARYRLLHSCSVAVARDMGLHLVDSTTTANTSDDLPTREMKRRLWWHLASTDWLLGFVGGPLDGTYAVQPRHFIVDRPRNLNDSDLREGNETLTHPMNVLTQVSCFLQRIRLAEICREMIDARAPELLDVEISDFNMVSSLDLLFERTLAEMPPFLQKAGPIPEGAPAYFTQQRDLLLLCLHFRRARLHRPFLLHDTDNPQYEPSRRLCVSSARTVLSISIEMMEGSPAATQDHLSGNLLAYRAGLVISSMFTACAVLALNAGLTWGRAARGARHNEYTAELHSEIARACRVIAKAGEKSTFAANLLRNLVGVLKQYSVKEIDDLAPPTNSTPNAEYFPNNGIAYHGPGSQVQSIGDSTNAADNFIAWNELFTAMPDMEGYDQLFAGLDYYCGPA